MRATAVLVHRQRLTGDFGNALWSALEAQLPAPDDAELRRVSTWLATFPAHGQLTEKARESVAEICKTLCATQSADPLPSLHYRGKKWCVDGLQDLQVEKLSRIAFYVLERLNSGEASSASR
ncbi:uncharacterized protein LOC129602256 [Paramacrobiotus metropolitanus]|uniref:uncharacterized protein LOC129602256 n=1 Tax=Paramacrobiotus metropolitanus TaxID=2943436 RepID=UPI00244634CB|nr:uncharacterized protein LOC129602256 [Paramacrobiotus metropolitanus]